MSARTLSRTIIRTGYEVQEGSGFGNCPRGRRRGQLFERGTRCRKDQFLVIVREDVVADNYSNGTRGAGRIRLWQLSARTSSRTIIRTGHEVQEGSVFGNCPRGRCRGQLFERDTRCRKDQVVGNCPRGRCCGQFFERDTRCGKDQFLVIVREDVVTDN